MRIVLVIDELWRRQVVEVTGIDDRIEAQRAAPKVLSAMRAMWPQARMHQVAARESADFQRWVAGIRRPEGPLERWQQQALDRRGETRR